MMQTSFGVFPSENHLISLVQEPGYFSIIWRNFYENRSYKETKSY